MTNGWVDIKNADVILAMGGNPAENHPCGFKWYIEAKKTRGAKLVVVDPRFTRTAAVADLYAPVRAGSDIAFLLGVIRYAIETKRLHEDYVKLHTNAPYIIGEKFGFDDGLFSGFDAGKGEYDKTNWAYDPDAKSKAYGVDPTLQNPRCVFQLLKKHVDRYTPETVEKICGTPKETFLKVCEIVTSTGNAQRCGTITYALGWTQHSIGVQIIRAAAMLQLLLGNVGRPGGGVNAFRGHSNIQGATDTAGTFEILPGYLKTPVADVQTLADYNKAGPPTTLNNTSWASMNYWVNYPKFMVSLLKAIYGNAATKENDFGYAWLPKVDGNYSWMFIYDDMYRGSSMRAGAKEPGPEGFLTFGMNPVGLGPNVKKMIAALSKLKWMVVVENVEIETAGFWAAPKEYGGAPPSQIQTEVYLLPASGFAEKDGTFTNSARWLQWKGKADETSLRLDYRARVLVAEDEHELRELIARWLETRHYQVAEAADGKDAIDLLQAGFDADVILLDLAMPRLDGRTFLEWLRASPEHRHRRVIVASGYLDERPVDADRTFAKPFRPDLLERELARLAEDD